MTDKTTGDVAEALSIFDKFCAFIDDMHMSGTFVENDFMNKKEQQTIRRALTQQPDVNMELLEALKLPQTMEIAEAQYRYNEAFNHGINACIKAITRATQPVDVEKLKRNSCHYFRKTGQYCNDGCFVCEQDIGYNEAIDHLAASGYLHAPQPRIDVEKLKREVGDKYGRTDYAHNNGWRYVIGWAIDHLAAHYNITKKGE